MFNMYTRAYIKCPFVARDIKATDLVVRANHDKCVLCNNLDDSARTLPHLHKPMLPTENKFH